MKSLYLPLALACLALSACNPEQQPAAASAASAASATPAGAPAAPAAVLPTEPSGDVPAVVVPGAMAACDPAEVATVKWSFDHLPSPPQLVDVLVGTGDADLKLFVTGPTRSDAKTGPWVRPGSVFVLRDHDGGQELSRVTVQGPKCG